MRLTESGLHFDFDEARWSVVRWDGSAPARAQANALPETCATDFVAILDSEVLYLIEVKNYATFERRKEEDLDVEIARKVHDTVVGLIGAHRRESLGDVSAVALTAMRGDLRRIVVVFWYEPHAFGRRDGTPDMRRVAAILQVVRNRIAGKLKWLHVTVVTRATSDGVAPLPGIRVTRSGA